tara:strand:- start:750 stop:1274 length:525 start_codon:yes stop_codon:yes gene_type:complete
MAKLEAEARLEQAIPGSSLTAEPKSRPWRRAYRYSTIDEVAMHYITLMMDPQFIEGLKEQVDVYPLSLIADALVSISTMEGVHSIDLGTLASPIIIETMKAMLEQEGVSYKIGNEKQSEISDVALREIRDSLSTDTDDLEQTEVPIIPDVEEKEVSTQEEEDENINPMGLMSRR